MLVRTRVIYAKDLSKFGAPYALRHLVSNLLQGILFRFFGITHEDSISRAQLRLSKYLYSRSGGKIIYGPFSGLQLQWNSSWGAKSRGTMLLGIYELEVLRELIEISRNYRFFIDVGAADGYYALGALFGGYFEKSFCYEASQNGREVIKGNAEVNGLTDRVVIRGMATSEFFHDFQPDVRDDSVVLVDIEGGEFRLLSNEALFAFRKSVVIIEIHDWMVSDGKSELLELENRVLRYFNIKKLRTGAREPAEFEELAEVSDTERWLVCSESREMVQTWWVLTPH